jgi:hypothetical protein
MDPRRHSLSHCTTVSAYYIPDYNFALERFAAHPAMCKYVTANGHTMTAPIATPRYLGADPMPLTQSGMIMRLNTTWLLDAWFLPTDKGLMPARGSYIIIDLCDHHYIREFADVLVGPMDVMIPRAGVATISY